MRLVTLTPLDRSVAIHDNLSRQPRCKSISRHARLELTEAVGASRRHSEPTPRMPALLYNAEHTGCRPGGETGRRTGLKIPRGESSVPVRFRSRAPRAPFPPRSFGYRSGFRLRAPASLTPAIRLNLKSRGAKAPYRFDSAPGHHEHLLPQDPSAIARQEMSRVPVPN